MRQRRMDGRLQRGDACRRAGGEVGQRNMARCNLRRDGADALDGCVARLKIDTENGRRCVVGRDVADRATAPLLACGAVGVAVVGILGWQAAATVRGSGSPSRCGIRPRHGDHPARVAGDDDIQPQELPKDDGPTRPTHRAGTLFIRCRLGNWLRMRQSAAGGRGDGRETTRLRDEVKGMVLATNL